jgi:hypothetical protein
MINMSKISKSLKACVKTEIPDKLKLEKLESYQKRPFEILRQPNNDSLLLVYQTGAGKTLTACFTAVQMITDKKVDNVIFILPPAILNQCHFQRELKIFMKWFKMNNTKQTFIKLNTQLTKENLSEEELNAIAEDLTKIPLYQIHVSLLKETDIVTNLRKHKANEKIAKLLQTWKAHVANNTSTTSMEDSKLEKIFAGKSKKWTIYLHCGERDTEKQKESGICFISTTYINNLLKKKIKKDKLTNVQKEVPSTEEETKAKENLENALKNSLVIVDEVHELRNGYVSGGCREDSGTVSKPRIPKKENTSAIIINKIINCFSNQECKNRKCS